MRPHRREAPAASLSRRRCRTVAEDGLSKASILDAAEGALRKFGLAKTNMSDVARALGVSHAALYRHYENKAALRLAVVERWMGGVFEPLGAVLAEEAPPETKLYRWLSALREFKRERARQDPELFAMYAALVAETAGALEGHARLLAEQLAGIIEAGAASGAFVCKDARQAAAGVFYAFTRFHHAAHAAEWDTPESEAGFEAVWQLTLRGLGAGS
nr:TetR family transcriptional regulator [Paenibacillus artemisiicola]